MKLFYYIFQRKTVKNKKRVDKNQADIVNALRAVGASVAVLSAVGRGVPDLLVGFRGVNYLLEVKNLDGRGDALTPAEVEFFETWRGHVCKVTDALQALSLLSK